MQLYTVLTVANAFTTGVDSHVKGKFSGAVGYVVTAVSNTTGMTLRDVLESFK